MSPSRQLMVLSILLLADIAQMTCLWFGESDGKFPPLSRKWLQNVELLTLMLYCDERVRLNAWIHYKPNAVSHYIKLYQTQLIDFLIFVIRAETKNCINLRG
jgi:hypothetical protein